MSIYMHHENHMKEFVRKNNSSIFLGIFFLIFILATYKYIANGEQYVFSTPWQDSPIELNSNIISQDIIIGEKEDWGNKSFAVYLSLENVDTSFEKEGFLKAELWQEDKLIDGKAIPSAWLQNGYNDLKWLDFSKLESGTAKVLFYGENLNFSVNAGLTNNIYNIPNCFVNGNDSGSTLVQRYHYNYNNFAHILGVIFFIILLLITITSFYILTKKNINWSGASIVLTINLILSYMLLVYIYEGSLYLEPTWAEAVTNFMHTSKYDSFTNTILKTDAGYLPLFQRCIAVFFIDVLKLSPYYALYAMQITAYLISGIVFSFFMWDEFDDVLPRKIRYVISLLVMCLTIQTETGAFINFITYGAFAIFLYFLANSRKWSNFKFVLICVFCFLTCLSKGVFVTMLPFMAVCMILFFRNFSRRDYIFCGTTALGALLQLLYYLKIGADWVDKSNMSAQENYYIKLIAEIFVDTPSKLMSIFQGNVTIFNGLSWFIILGFWGLVAYAFLKHAMIKWVKKEQISKNFQIVFMMLIYVMAQSLFLRMTVYGVNTVDILTDEFWTLNDYGIDNRYQVMVFFAVVIIGISLMKNIYQNENYKNSFYVMLAVCTIVCMGSSRLQIKGLGNDDYSTRTNWGSALTSDLSSEIVLIKKIDSMESILIPIQPTICTYSKNCKVYCFGSNIYGWNLESNFAADDVYSGKVNLSTFGTVNPETRIYQAFIKKNCLVGSNNYKINIYDADGNILISQVQDNDINQKSTSFTFEIPIQNAATVQIVDSNDNQVYIENALYIVINNEDQLYTQ